MAGPWEWETECVRRIRMGETGLYRQLLEPHLEAATRFAYGMLQERTAADDAVQEAGLRAWQRLGNLRPGCPFRPWFLAIVRNCCRETRRSRWWLLRRLSDQDDGLRGDEEEEEDWLAGADLRRAVAELPPGERAAILLHFYDDLPLDQVATALGIGQAGVKSRINRGLRKLRRTLGTDT